MGMYPTDASIVTLLYDYKLVMRNVSFTTSKWSLKSSFRIWGTAVKFPFNET